MTDKFVKDFRFACYSIVTPAFCVFGIICNLLNLVVITRRALRRLPYIYLASLAVVDNGVLVMYLIYTSKSLMTTEGVESKLWRYYDVFVMAPIINVFTSTSVWIIVFISVERFNYVRVARLAGSSSLHRCWVKVKIATVFVAAVVINIPRFYLFTVEKSGDRYVIRSTLFRASKTYYAMTVVKAIVVHFIPLTIVFVCNVYLIRYLVLSRYSRRRVRSSSRNEDIQSRVAYDEKRSTITLTAITVLFLVTITPSAFTDRPIAFAIYHGEHSWDDFAEDRLYNCAQIVANVLVIANCSLNFVLYCGFNAIFKQTLKLVVLRCCRYVKRCALKACGKGGAMGQGDNDQEVVSFEVTS